MKLIKESSSQLPVPEGDSYSPPTQRLLVLSKYQDEKTDTDSQSLSINLDDLLAETEKQKRILKEDTISLDSVLNPSSPAKSRRIFISHSSQNTEIATQLQSFLIKMGFDRNDVFCSSIPGQGIAAGEQINKTIFQNIDSASQIIFLISQHFLSSSFCMEELGIGWYLSVKGKCKCSYLVLPDTELEEIYGFINKSAVQLTVLNEKKNDALCTFVESICENYNITPPKPTIYSVEANQFWNNTRKLFKKIVALQTKQKRKQEQLERLNAENTELRKQIQQLNQSNTVEVTNRELKIEYDILLSQFRILGLTKGFTQQEYDCLGKDFWFQIVHRYLDLSKELGIETRDYAMENLVAKIYLYNHNYEEAYLHFLNNIRLRVISGAGIYSIFLKDFIKMYPHSMANIIDLIAAKVPDLREGSLKDSYLNTLNILREREIRLGTDNQ